MQGVCVGVCVCVSILHARVYMEFQAFTGTGNSELGGSRHLWSQQLLRADTLEV